MTRELDAFLARDCSVSEWEDLQIRDVLLGLGVGDSSGKQALGVCGMDLFQKFGHALGLFS